MADWSTIASLSTAAGTLVLAVATFSAVRASQPSARIAEQAPLIGQARPGLHAAAGYSIDLLYSDYEGGQRAVSRFTMWPTDA